MSPSLKKPRDGGIIAGKDNSEAGSLFAPMLSKAMKGPGIMENGEQLIPLMNADDAEATLKASNEHSAPSVSSGRMGEEKADERSRQKASDKAKESKEEGLPVLGMGAVAIEPSKKMHLGQMKRTAGEKMHGKELPVAQADKRDARMSEAGPSRKVANAAHPGHKSRPSSFARNEITEGPRRKALVADVAMGEHRVLEQVGRELPAKPLVAQREEGLSPSQEGPSMHPPMRQPSHVNSLIDSQQVITHKGNFSRVQHTQASEGRKRFELHVSQSDKSEITKVGGSIEAEEPVSQDRQSGSLNISGHLANAQLRKGKAAAKAAVRNAMPVQHAVQANPAGSSSMGGQPAINADSAAGPASLAATHLATTPARNAQSLSTSAGQTSGTNMQIDQMMMTLNSMISGGKQRIEIQLHPKEMGKVDIQVDTDSSKHLHVRLFFENPMARQMFDAQIAQLRQSMLDQGFENVSFDFGQYQQGMAQQGDDFASFQGQKDGWQTNASSSVEEQKPVHGTEKTNETSRLSIRV